MLYIGLDANLALLTSINCFKAVDAFKYQLKLNELAVRRAYKENKATSYIYTSDF